MNDVTGDRMALLVPSTNTTVQRDAEYLHRQGIAETATALVHQLPMYPEDQGPDTLAAMNEHLAEAGRRAAGDGAAVACYFCTTGSFFEGHAREHDLRRQLEEGNAMAAVTTAAAASAALRALGARTIVVLSPYLAWINDRLRTYYEAAGFEINALFRDEAAADSGFEGINGRSVESIVGLASAVDVPDSDAAFLPCTAWRALEAVHELERVLERPVVTANQATFWAGLRALGRTDHLEPLGTLGAL